MRRLFLRTFLVLAAIFAVVWFVSDATPVFAQAQDDVFGVQEVGEGLPLGGGDIRVIVVNIIRVALSLLGLAAVIIVLYGGFVYMTAQGDAERVAQARKILINGTIGLAIILSSLAIVQFVFSSLQGAILGGDGNNNGGGGPVVGCEDLGGCNDGNPNVCLEREDLFVVESITPSTPGPQDDTRMSNIVVRAIFSQPLGQAFDADDVLTVTRGDNELVIDEARFVSNQVVEVIYEMDSVVCDNYNLENDGDDERCIEDRPGAVFNIEIADAIRSADGDRLQENTVCGQYPTDTRFTIGDERVDKRAPEISSLEVDGRSGNGIILRRGQSYNIDATINDRPDGRRFGGVGMARLRIRLDDENAGLVDAWERYFGPRVQDGSSGQYRLSRNVRFGDEFDVPARYEVEVQAFDIDSNQSIETAEIILVGELCQNGIQDRGETDIDVGGQCLGEGLCQENWQCRSQRCENNQCVLWPMISAINETSGAAGNLVTIAGQFFGQDQGQVFFGIDANNDGELDEGQNWIAANADVCGAIDTWHDDMIVAQVPSNDLLPEGTQNIIRVVRADNAEASDTTRDEHGALVDYFVKNNTILPGLCAVQTIDEGARAAIAGTPVRAIGVNLGNGQNSTIRFGGVQVGFDRFEPTQIDTFVPDNAGIGRLAVVVERQGIRTNGIPFTILEEENNNAGRPIVRAVSPAQVTPGSLVTVQGDNFGNRTGLVYITQNGNDPCRSDNGAVRDGCLPLELDLPGQCGVNWNNDEIIALLPRNVDLDDVDQQFGDNVILDGDMEAGDVGAWGQYSNNPGLEVFEKDNETVNEGNQSLHLVRLDNQVAGIIQRDVPVEAGATYRFSIDYLQQADEGSIGVVIRNSDGINTLRSDRVGQARQNNWERLTYDIEIPADENELLFFVTTRGDVYLDNIQLREITQAAQAIGDYVIVVETADQLLSNADTQLRIEEGEPLPGICRLSPAVGPAPLPGDQTLQVDGVNFDNTLQAFFFGRGSNVADLRTWLQTDRNDGIANVAAQQFTTVIPVDNEGYSMQTGPIRVQTDAGVSNPITYRVARCTDPGVEAPGPGFQCCQSGPDAGLFRPANQVCAGETREGAYMYRFSTGRIPDVPVVVEQCNVDAWNVPGAVVAMPSPSPWNNWPNGNNACINRNITVQFSTEMDEATINNANVRLFTCPANDNGDVDCDEERVVVPIDPAYAQQQLIIWDGEADLEPNTTYRVELAQGIQSFRRENVAGQDVDLRAPLSITRPCGGDTAYCFEFTTGNRLERCQLEDVYITPPTNVADRLGLVRNSRGNPFYYLVHGRGNQVCSVLPVDGLGWVWRAQNPLFANASVAPTLGNTRFVDSRAMVEALQETAPEDVLIEAQATVSDGERNFLQLAGVQGNLDAEVQGVVTIDEEQPEGSYNLTTGDSLIVDFQYDHHNGNLDGFLRNDDREYFRRKNYILNKSRAYAMFIEEIIYDDGRPDLRVLQFNLYCDGFERCENEADNPNPAGFRMPLRIDGPGAERLEIVISDNALTVYRGADRQFFVQRNLRNTDIVNNNFSEVAVGGFSENAPPFEGVIRQASITRDPQSYFATSSLVIDLGEPGVLDYFPFCTDSCTNATIGLSFTRSMATTTFADGFSIRECQSEACDSFVGGPVDLLALPQQSDRMYKVQPLTPLKEDVWYLATATSSIFSVAKQAENGQPQILGKPIQPFSWKFRTKQEDGLCVINSVDVLPDSHVARSIGEKTVYAAIPRSQPNQCNAVGQELNPWGYGWDWQIGDESVATISSFEGHANQSSFCGDTCTLRGSDISIESYEEDFPICGNGVVEVGEDCDIAGIFDPDGLFVPGAGANFPVQLLREVPGQSCSYQCLRPGNDDSFNPEADNNDNTCGNGVVDWRFGEECDPADPETGGFCSDRCLNLGSSDVASGNPDAPICGSGEITRGEDCDGGEGCSPRCLNEGTDLSQAWCDAAVIPNQNVAELCAAATSVCGDGIIEAGEACEVGVNGATVETCSDRCLIQNACGTPVAECEAGTEGCSDQCVLLGSSILYSNSSLCGDGVVGIGEVAQCEVANGNAIGENPVQVVTAVGEGEAIDDSQRQETTITAQALRFRQLVDGEPVVSDIDPFVDTAQYALQCGFEEYLSPVPVANIAPQVLAVRDPDMERLDAEEWPTLIGDATIIEKVAGALPDSGQSLAIESVNELAIYQKEIAILPNTRYQVSFRYRVDRGFAGFSYGFGQSEQIVDQYNQLAQQLPQEQDGIFSTIIATGDADRLFSPVFIINNGRLIIDDVQVVEIVDSVPLSYNNCPNNGDNSAGVAGNSCCYVRPTRQQAYPVDGTGLQGDRSVCRNTGISVVFDDAIDESSIADNIILAAGYDADENRVCGDNEADVTELVRATFDIDNNNQLAGNFFERVWGVIKQFFVRLFSGDVFARGIAPPEDIAVWCANVVPFEVNTRVVAEDDDAFSTIVDLAIDTLLDGDRTYAVLLRGGQSGIRNIRGVGIVSPEADEHGVLPPNDAIVFRTRDQICRIDRVEVDPASAIFTTPEEEREFSAQAFNDQDEAIVRTTAYDWNWEWVPTNNDIFTIPVPPAQTSTPDTVIASRNVEGNLTAVAAARVIADANPDNNHFGRAFFGTTDLSAVFCENPWPSRNNYPYQDDQFNFSFAYCADAGQSGNTDDDLPFLIEQGLDLVNDDDQLLVLPGTLKRSFFFNNQNDDVIGIQISANPNQLTLREWYEVTFRSALPESFGVTSVAGYQALTNGTTYYVQALNEDRNNVARPVYNNIYIFTISANAQLASQQVFEAVVNSLQFNTNMTDLGFCQVPGAQAAEDITNIACVNDFSCQEANGRSLPGTNGVCSQDRTKMYRDWNRLVDIGRIQQQVETVVNNDGQYPRLAAGTFIPGYTNSQWGSWNNALGDIVGPLPRDPVSQWSTCDDRDGQTCWDPESATLLCPQTAQIYEYSVNEDNSGYTIHAPLEYFDEDHPFVSFYVAPETFTTERWCTPATIHSPFDGICGDGVVNEGEQCDPAGSSEVVNQGFVGEVVGAGRCQITNNACTDALRDCGGLVENVQFAPDEEVPGIVYEVPAFCGFEKDGVTRAIMNLDETERGEYATLFSCRNNDACKLADTYGDARIGVPIELEAFDKFEDFNQYLVQQGQDIRCITTEEYNGKVVPPVQQCVDREIDAVLAQCPLGESATRVCNDNCQYDYGICQAAASCGNGILEAGEVCDAGENNGEYGRCNNDCQGFGEAGRCGDGLFDAVNEQCEFTDTLYATAFSQDGNSVARAVYYTQAEREEAATEKCAILPGAFRNLCIQYLAGNDFYDLDPNYRCANDQRHICSPDNANSCRAPFLGDIDGGLGEDINLRIIGILDLLSDDFSYPTIGSYFVRNNDDNAIEDLGACVDVSDGVRYGLPYHEDPALTCSWDCQGLGAYCGDGIVDFVEGEQCDDGNSASGDGCTSACLLENISCKNQAPFVIAENDAGQDITQITTLVGAFRDDAFTIDSCYDNTTPEQICRAYGLVCDTSEPGEDQDAIRCDSDLTEYNRLSGGINRAINCLGVYEGEQPDGTVQQVAGPQCGNGELDPGEQCDLGEVNGVACDPAYGQSCSYCSNQCRTLTVDPIAFCGNGQVDEGEICDVRPDGTVIAVANQFQDPDTAEAISCTLDGLGDDLNDKGAYQCANQCRSLTNTCTLCGRGGPGDGASPRMFVTNPLGSSAAWEDATSVFLVKEHSFSQGVVGGFQNPFGQGGNDGIVINGYRGLENTSVRALSSLNQNGRIFDADRLDGYGGSDTPIDDTIVANQFCADEYSIVFNYQPVGGGIDQGSNITSIAQPLFAYPANADNRVVSNEYVINPNVPEGFMRMVIRWDAEQAGNAVIAGNLYNANLAGAGQDQNRISYLDLFDPNESRLCDSFARVANGNRVQNYWLPSQNNACVFGDYDYFFSRHQLSDSGSTGVQAITIDLREQRDGAPYAFFVSAISAEAQNMRRIADFRNSDVVVEVYTGSNNPNAIQKPARTFRLQEAITGFSSSQARYWHVFNLVQGENGEYEIQTLDQSPFANDGTQDGTIETDFCQVRQNVENACNPGEDLNT